MHELMVIFVGLLVVGMIRVDFEELRSLFLLALMVVIPMTGFILYRVNPDLLGWIVLVGIGGYFIHLGYEMYRICIEKT